MPTTTSSIYGELTLSDTTPTPVPIVYNGQSISQIDIPSGTLHITDVLIGIGFIYWAIEVDRGSGFTSIATFGFTLLVPFHTEIKKFNTPIAIDGGPGVAMRIVATAVTPPIASCIGLQATLKTLS